MALEFQTVPVPAVGGLDQSVHERVAPVESISVLINGEYEENGDIVKRAGFVEVDTAIGSGAPTVGEGGNVRGIFDGGNELLVLGYRQLYARNPTRDKWYRRGYVSPYGGTITPRMRDERTFLCPDVFHNDGFVGYCAQVRSEFWDSETSEGTWNFAIEVLIYDENDSRTFTTHTAEAVTIGPQANLLDSDLFPHSPRMFGTGQVSGVKYLHMACAEGALGAQPHDIHIYSYDSTPDTAPSAAASTPVTDLWTDESVSGPGNPENFAHNWRTYDAIDAERSNYYDLAWINEPDQYVNLRQYNGTTHAATLSLVQLTTNAPYVRVALCQDRSSNANQLFVAAVSVVGEPSGNAVEVWSRDADDYTANWGPVVIKTYATVGSVENLGIAHDGENGKLIVSWTWVDSAGWSSTMTSRVLTDAGTPELAAVEVENFYNYSRPFYRAGRPYVAGCYDLVANMTTNARLDAIALNSATLLVDLDPGTSSRKPLMVGMWSAGESVPMINSFGKMRHGVGCNVAPAAEQSATSEKFYLAHTSVAETLPSQDTAPPYGYPIFSFGANEVELDFGALPNATRVGKTAIVIGGGHLSYYDGGYCHELGFGAAPMFEVAGPTTAGAVAVGDYLCTAHWEHTSNGVVHRSAPGTPVSHAQAGIGFIRWTALTLPCSHRVDDEVNLICSASNTDELIPIARRTQPFEMKENDTASATIDFAWDAGSEYRAGPPVYTSIGADLANVTPEGALVVSTAIERLWTGAHYAKDVVHFSDPFVAGSRGEDKYAPELNDALVKLATDGHEVTFIYELDDNVIIGTTNTIYALTGEGPDNAGLASDFPPLRRLSNDRGCTNRRSAVVTPDGIMFQSQGGLYLLTRSLDIEFVGLPVRQELETFGKITSAVLVPERRQVRFTCAREVNGVEYGDAVIMVYDYQFRAWSKWIVKDGEESVVVPIGACVHGGQYWIVTQSGDVYGQTLENPSTWRDTDIDSNTDWVPLTVRAGWFQPSGHGSWLRVEEVAPLCRWMTAHDLRIKLYADYESTEYKDLTIPNADLVTYEQEGVREQPEVSVTRPECQAFTWEITDEDPGSGTGRGYTYSGAAVTFGFQRGRARTPGAQRR